MDRMSPQSIEFIVLKSEWVFQVALAECWCPERSCRLHTEPPAPDGGLGFSTPLLMTQPVPADQVPHAALTLRLVHGVLGWRPPAPGKRCVHALIPRT